jgi:exportin-2 (importin alpha re-exporter)
MLISTANSVLHIIESVLSQEELPDFYEENLEQIAQACTFLLNTEFPLMQATPVDREAVYRTKAKVVRLVHLYQFKFGEYFATHADIFFQAIWQVIADGRVTAAREAERLVFALVKYIGECTNIGSYSEFIKQNLALLFSVVVLPNISLTQEDVDEFEDDPQQYIKNDLEESDQETRRRHCMKFVQQLSRKYQAEMAGLIGDFITQLNCEYEQNKAQHWQKKITLLNLLITASIGCYTYQQGATEILVS